MLQKLRLTLSGIFLFCVSFVSYNVDAKASSTCPESYVPSHLAEVIMTAPVVMMTNIAQDIVVGFGLGEEPKATPLHCVKQTHRVESAHVKVLRIYTADIISDDIVVKISNEASLSIDYYVQGSNDSDLSAFTRLTSSQESDFGIHEIKIGDLKARCTTHQRSLQQIGVEGVCIRGLVIHVPSKDYPVLINGLALFKDRVLRFADVKRSLIDLRYDPSLELKKRVMDSFAETMDEAITVQQLAELVSAYDGSGGPDGMYVVEKLKFAISDSYNNYREIRRAFHSGSLRRKAKRTLREAASWR